MNKPLVSVVIPVYNGKNYLRDAIDSVLFQTYENIEIIVVNDGSTDGDATEKITLSYGKKIRYFSKQNGGVATALNYGIDRMQGEYFSWLSHDDMYYPNKIEMQVEALNKRGDKTAIVFSGYDVIDENTRVKTYVNIGNIYKRADLENSVFPLLYGLIHGCTLLIHKSHFERVGGFNESLKTTQDYDLWFRMFRGQNTIYIQEPLIIGRLHEAQGSRTIECHDNERNNLYMKFMEELNDEEINLIFSNKYNFYHRMACFFRGGNMMQGYQYAVNKFHNEKIPENISEKLSAFESYLKGISNEKATKIAIFCAGNYGMQLYEELRNRLIHVDCVADNNSDKWGYFRGNTYCISPEKLEKQKDNTLVIIATRTPDSILRQLDEMGFPYVTTKQQIDLMIADVPPIKWTTQLESLENVDYSSQEVLFLIEKFNETIFDICKYYEGKVKNSTS